MVELRRNEALAVRVQLSPNFKGAEQARGDLRISAIHIQNLIGEEVIA